VLSWSLTEVLACGTPVLAMANPMLKELIEPGVNGALWRGDPPSLGMAISQLLKDPERLMHWGVSSRQRMREGYHQKYCVDLLEKKLTQLACLY
jgi:glycosyltransferase involved in cell wall biosynthesis